MSKNTQTTSTIAINRDLTAPRKNKAQLVSEAKAKIASAKPTRSASPDPQHNAALAHAKVASERRKGDPSQGITLAPKLAPSETSPKQTTKAKPAQVEATATTKPAATLSGKFAIGEWKPREHGCARFTYQRDFNDNLAVAAALHCQVVAVRPHGDKTDGVAFVGSAANCSAAIALLAVLRWVYYEGAGEVGYKVRYRDAGIKSRTQCHNYSDAFGLGVASKAPAFAPSAALLADANVVGSVLSLSKLGTGFDTNAGFADGATCDFAAWFTARHGNAKVASTLPAILATPQAPPTQVETKSARTRKRAEAKQKKQLAA